MQLSLISLALTKVYGGAAAFSPLSLFASGEQGAWYDPSDLSTMFQDSEGTIPVTGDGQPVGKILDKSGRGNHASQATAASRPLYKTDGTHHWLQFDGVDDSLSTAVIDFTGTDKITNWYGISKSTDSGNGMAVEYSPGNSPGSFYFLAPAAGANYQFALTGSVSNATVGATITTYTAPIKNVLAVSYDTAQPARETEILVKVNGALVTPSSWVGAASCGSGPFGGYNLFIGRRGGTTLPFTGNIYSLIIRGALSTADEITATETWVNQRTGAY